MDKKQELKMYIERIENDYEKDNFKLRLKNGILCSISTDPKMWEYTGSCVDIKEIIKKLIT